MLGLIKALPLVLVLAGAGWAYHKITVAALENRVVDLQEEVDFTRAENVALQSASAINLATIDKLQQKSQAQAQQLGKLTISNQALSAERDEFMSVFKKHNLTKLARAKPGMIEPRINKGTSKVLRTIEEDSRELDQADDIDGEPDNAPVSIEQAITQDQSYTGESNAEDFDNTNSEPNTD